MKKSYIYNKGVAVLALAFTMTSCSDFLDKEPSSETTKEETFSTWSTMEQFHFDTYNFLRHGAACIGNSWLDAATDLAETSLSNSGARQAFNIGNYYAGAASDELTGRWESRYRAIRKCNMLLQEIDNVPRTGLTAEEYAEKLEYFKGEAHFFRAFFYWELFLRYGPVPIVLDVLDPAGDLLSDYKERPSIKEYVVDFILPELDLAEEMVMEKSVSDETANQGRVNKPTVAAMKSRIMLYMASERYSAESGVTWQQAVDAAKHFIDDYGNDYELVSEGSPVDNYTNAILLNAHTEHNPEVIFYRNDATVGWSSVSVDTPTGYGGSGGNCPSQNLVDMYDMADGQSPFTTYDETGAPVYTSSTATPAINVASGYDDQYPTAGRDPRLSATVLYNGANWGGRAIDVVAGGADNALGNANNTPTGYYMRKYIPENILNNNHSGRSYRNWIVIRYAEILLNYAEALNENGASKSEVLNAIQPLRNRVGMTALLTNRSDLNTQAARRNFLRKERTVELCFEEHRWWDVRRWNVAEKALGRDIIGVNVSANGVYTRKVAQTRKFESRMYLYPIPEEEEWKTSIANNEGWD